MSFRIFTSHAFDREAKRLTKKFSSLKNELEDMKKELLKHPTLGTQLGRNCYKIRLAVKSKGRGKSGGMRAISWVIYEVKSNIVSVIGLVKLYDKSERASISEKELVAALELAKQEWEALFVGRN